MFSFNHELQNKRVLLRRMTIDDYEAFRELTTESRMWVWFTHNLSDSAVLYSWVKAAVNENRMKTRAAYTVIDNLTGKIAGSTSIGNVSVRDRRVETGWTWLGQEWHGSGINLHMKYLMICHCFEELDMERIESKTDILNIPARKGLLRCGMTEEGILRSHTLMTDNRRRDTIYYSILKPEWPRVKANLTKVLDWSD
ncbi:MAG TPA: GNAT family protein [Bacteroidales bacterium]|nr:GNAT family protein [Bacteroidales bacterium]